MKPLMCTCPMCIPREHAPATQEDFLCDCCAGRCATCGPSCDEHRRRSAQEVRS